MGRRPRERTVQEIMNRELLAIRPETPAHEALHLLRSYGIGAAPVLDDDGRPIGVVSLRDRLEEDGTAAERMSRPALCVDTSATIEHAAARVVRADVHHLIVVDGSGIAVGMISTLDLLRGLLGLPRRHPARFPHWDEVTETSWTDEWPLEEETLRQAPEGPGVIALLTTRAPHEDVVVWAEECPNVRARARGLVLQPTEQDPALAPVLAAGGVRFRAAVIDDEAARARVVSMLRDRAEHVPPPGST